MEFFAAPIRLAIFGISLLALGGLAERLRADEGEQLVLLQNGNILRGISEVQGDLVILQRKDGSHLRLNRNQVSHVAATVEELYRYRSSQRSFRNPATCIDDIRWCLHHGLLDEAETELKNLRTLDPTHPEVAGLQRQVESARLPRSKAPLQLDSVAGEKAVDRESKTALPEGVSAASIAAFAARVQPMLINRCANAGCHRGGGDATWQLSTLGFNVRVSARMSQQNLAATLHYVNVDDPFSSELLRFTSTPHANGMYAPTSRDMQSAATTLREWLSQLGRYPQPLVAAVTTNLSSTPAVAAQSSFHKWPVSQASNNEPVPDGFAIDADGELIYDPQGSFADPEPEQYEGIVPPGWPAPVLGPTIETSKPDATPLNPNAKEANPVSNAPPASRPKRLPTIPNPFSADLFNRQHQRTSANDAAR